MPLPLLFLQLFTRGLIRAAVLPCGIGQCFSVTYCTVPTRITNRECLLFLGKPLLGGRRHITANTKWYLAFPTGNDCGKPCLDPALPIHPHSRAGTGTFGLLVFCTTLHRDAARAIGMTHVPSLEHEMRHFSPPHCIYKFS